MPFWFDENFQNESRFGVRAEKMLFEERSKFQKISIVETEKYGRVLAIDNIFMTSEFEEYLYHEMIVHPALNTVANPERVLIIGGGDGGCASEVLSHDAVKQVVMVEIDEVVVEACKRFLPTIGKSWDDPRLEVIIGDGIDYAVNAQVEPFDVILLDGSDPVGPAVGLFDVNFFRGCERLLAPDGVFALQSESPVLQRETFLEIGRALGGIFPMVYPYFGNVPIYASGSWSWTYATRVVNPFSIIEDRTSRQEERCRHYNRDIHRAAFAVPNEFRAIFNNGKVNPIY